MTQEKKARVIVFSLCASLAIWIGYESPYALMAILLGISSLIICFLPAIAGRKKRNAGAIFALNFSLGWTLVGWVVALVWAYAKDLAHVVQVAAAAPATAVLCSSCGKYSAPGGAYCSYCAAKY
jgi:hypothetical protein